MYRNERKALIFPKLVYEKSTTGVKALRDDEEISVYTLDWAGFDRIVHAKRERVFPEGSVHKLNIAHYAIPPHYRREIRRCVKLAIIEWDRSLPFDTNIREACLITAQAFVETAFDLLADCAYDMSMDEADTSSETCAVLHHALLYRFWDGQTGQGLVWKNARLDALKEKAVYVRESGFDPDFSEAALSFLRAVQVSESLNMGESIADVASEQLRMQIDKETLAMLDEQSSSFVEAFAGCEVEGITRRYMEILDREEHWAPTNLEDAIQLISGLSRTINDFLGKKVGNGLTEKEK